MSISAVVVRSLTTQPRSQKVPSANYVRQLQSFHYHIARLATGSFLVCVAGCENIASRSGPTRRRPAFEIGLVQSPDDHTHASPNNMRTLNCASQRTCVDEVGKGYAQRSQSRSVWGPLWGPLRHENNGSVALRAKNQRYTSSLLQYTLRLWRVFQ